MAHHPHIYGELLDMVRTVLSMLLFGIIGFTLAYNRIDLKMASYWVIMGCAVAIALVYYFVK